MVSLKKVFLRNADKENETQERGIIYEQTIHACKKDNCRKRY